MELFAPDQTVSLKQTVNVASVPQRSPFRYPGGKTWLVPQIRRWLKSVGPRVAELVEPFAGGGIVSLTAVFENLVPKATLGEMDEEVAAVWRTIFGQDGEWLGNRIVAFELTPHNVAIALSQNPTSLREKAFLTILKNRVNRGGILAPGAGVLRYGENGKGLASRWYPVTLKRRIFEICAVKHKLRVIEGDAFDIVQQNRKRPDAAFFIDPPYTVAGRRLYRHASVDHNGLFHLMSQTTGDFLMTYDNTDEIVQLAEKYGFQHREIVMKSTHHRKKMELLIGRNLEWVGE